MDRKIIILIVALIIAAAALGSYFLFFSGTKKAPAPKAVVTSTPSSDDESPSSDEEEEEEEEEYVPVNLGEETSPTYEGSGDSPSEDESPSPDVESPSPDIELPPAPGVKPPSTPPAPGVKPPSTPPAPGVKPPSTPPAPGVKPPPPAGPIKASIACGGKVVVITVTSNPKNTPMSLYSPQKKTDGGLIRGNIVRGRVQVGPLAWIDPKKPTQFFLAINSASYKAGKYVARCTKPGSGAPPPPASPTKPDVIIKCAPKKATVIMRKNPKNIPMKLFSPQKPGNDGLIKYNIVKGKVTVGPLTWMDPAKKTVFVVAASNADYKAKKWIATCSTTPTKPTKLSVTIKCAPKKATVVVKANPKNVPMKLFSPQKPGNDGLIKYNIVKGKVTVGPLTWMDPAKKTVFVVAASNADYKAKKWIATCEVKGKKSSPPPAKKQGKKSVRRVLWVPSDYRAGSKMRGFHDFNVELSPDGTFKILDGKIRNVDVGKAIAANSKALKGCMNKGDIKNAAQLQRCMRTWHDILGKNTGNNLRVDAGRTSGTYKAGTDGDVKIKAGAKLTIGGKSKWKNFAIRVDNKKMKENVDYVLKKM
jgi:hypothetical protein